MGVPIFVSLGLSGFVTFLATADMPLTMFSQKFYSNIFSFPLMAIPFFLLTSAIMETSGLSNRIINMADAVVGSIKGNLAMTGMLSCAIFASISGSSLATVASIGGILIPRMLKEGYDNRLAIGSIVAAGTLGILIPPSIPMIVYGMITGTSIVKLFLAAIVPGILLTIILMVATFIFVKRGWSAGTPRVIEWTERRMKLRKGGWTLLIPVSIFVGIYGIPGIFSAIFTPTEAAIVAVFLSLFISIVIYREFSIRQLPNVMGRSMSQIGMILILISTALLFSFVVNDARIPQQLADFIISIDLHPLLFLLVVNILLFIAGQFMDALPIILIFIPVLFPAAIALGIDPVHFGIMTIINMELGCITPPVGLNLFMAANISKLNIVDVIKASLPWIGVILIFLLFITYVPVVSLWLPNLLK
jgi:C4-dicarboxylate transporter DctM subunit